MTDLPAPPPIGTLNGIRSGIAGAILLAKGRPEGIQQIAADPDATRTSFWAAAICLPAMLVLRMTGSAVADPSLHDFLAPTLLYAIGWAGYAILSHRVATAMGRQNRWPIFIAAWNWCQLIQYALFLISAVPGWIDAPAWLGQTLGMVALFWAMWLQWFATRTALDLSRWSAAALVALDVIIGIVVSQ